MSSTWYFYVPSYSYFLILLFIFFSFIPYYSLLLVLLFLFFSSYSILPFSFFSSHSFLLIIIFLHFKLYVLLQTCILIIYCKYKIRKMSQFEKKSVNNGNLTILLNSLKLGHLQTPQGKKTLG